MIKKMTKHWAEEIVNWQYEVPYDTYNMTTAYDELLSSYHAVYEETLIGFYCMGPDAQVPPGDYPDTYLDFGIGMKPNLCGKGLGEAFMVEVISELRKEGKPLRLTVLSFNKRAIKLYQKLGFKEVQQFKRGERLFIIMTE